MSDPGVLERYCSSYYDRFGLYNDGFPCPSDKYCCQNMDGTKMCCVISKKQSSSSEITSNLFRKMQSTSSPQTVVNPSTLLNKFKSIKSIDQLSPLDTASSSPSSMSSTSTPLSALSSSPWPFLITKYVQSIFFLFHLIISKHCTLYLHVCVFVCLFFFPSSY